jgi:hypothetical protein
VERARSHQSYSSYAGLTRVSIAFHERLAKGMDCRVKPGNDEFLPPGPKGPQILTRRPTLQPADFKAIPSFVRSLRLAVRTSPSHGENRSSILLGSASNFNNLLS